MSLRSRLSLLVRRARRSSSVGLTVLKPVVHGYIDEILEDKVVGWMWNPFDPKIRLSFKVLVLRRGKPCVVASSIADNFYPALAGGQIGDAKYGFSIQLPSSITSSERSSLMVIPDLSQASLERSPFRFEGYVDELSNLHVAGWIRDRLDPEARCEFEVAIERSERRVIATGTANLLNLALQLQSVGDAHYSFRILFDEALSEEDRLAVVIRPVGGRSELPLSPYLVTAFEPLDHVAVDIVNNCNLRCPFCLFDYSDVKVTKTMSSEVFDSALKLIPYVRDGNFWLSCLHEPTLNPEFLSFIERIPQQWRRKVMFTTNLAKRMPAKYFNVLAESGISHINISLESTNPAIFERMRKGARWAIFSENWNHLIEAWRAAANPPRIRYIIMAYQSNLAEIPGLVKLLRQEKLPWQVEVRHTYNAEHIPRDFRSSEFLSDADWHWLEKEFQEYSVDQVMLIPPPELGQPRADEATDDIKDTSAHLDESLPSPDGADQLTETSIANVEVDTAPETSPDALPIADLIPLGERRLAQPYNIQIEWDGKLVVYGKWENPPKLMKFAEISLTEETDPDKYILSL